MNDIKSRETEIHNKTMEMSNNLIYREASGFIPLKSI